MRRRTWNRLLLTMIYLVFFSGIAVWAADVNWRVNQSIDVSTCYSQKITIDHSGYEAFAFKIKDLPEEDNLFYLGVNSAASQQFKISIYDENKWFYDSGIVSGKKDDLYRVYLKRNSVYYITAENLDAANKEPITLRIASNYMLVRYRDTGRLLAGEMEYEKGSRSTAVIRKDEVFYPERVKKGEVNPPVYGFDKELTVCGWMKTIDDRKRAELIFWTDPDKSKAPGYAFGTQYLDLFDWSMTLWAIILQIEQEPSYLPIAIVSQGGTYTEDFNRNCTANGDGTFSYTFGKNSVVVREGYRLLGWSKDPSAKTPTYRMGDTVKGVTRQDFFYCIWEKLPVLTLQQNDGSGKTETLFANDDYAVQLPSTDYVRDGYLFTGWAEDPKAEYAAYTKGQRLNLKADKTLYAVWESAFDRKNISGNFAHAYSSNAAKTVAENKKYETTITPESGYVLSKVTVIMDGVILPVEMTDSKCTIHIAKVTGDVEIVATAVKKAAQDNKPEKTEPQKVPEAPSKTVPNAALKKLTPGKGSMTVKWKKAVGIDGYEIQYALKKNFKGAQTIVVKNPAKQKFVIKKLKAKKLYYVRIRTYKMDGGKKLVPVKWSKALKMKIK